MVALVAYQNIFPKQTNNRLIAYYRLLEDERHEPRFYFIKGRGDLPDFRSWSFQTFLVKVPYVGILAGIIRAWFFFLFDRRDKIIYLYDPNAFWWPLTKLWKIQGRNLIVERTELHSSDAVRGFKAKFLRTLYTLDERTVYQKQVVISERIKEHIEKHRHSRIHVVPAFFESRYFEGTYVPSEHLKIGYLGSFGKKDAVHDIIHACELLRQHHPSATVHLFGPLEQFVRLDRAFHFPDWVHYEGSPVYTQLAENLRSCSMLISFRDRSAYSQFGFPTKLIEYLASGVPVISTRSAEVDKLFSHEEHLLLCQAENVSELAELMHFYAARGHIASEIAQQGREQVAKVSEFSHFRAGWLDFLLN